MTAPVLMGSLQKKGIPEEEGREESRLRNEWKSLSRNSDS
jgi:hypothetical protein